MKVLIRQARIISPGSEFHGLLKDIYIIDGFISDIGNKLTLPGEAEEISIPGLHVSPGWMDTFALFGEPGFEYRETIASGSAAAAAGGFTDVLLMPNTNPPVSNRSQIEYLRTRAASLPVTIHPAGSITRDNSGKELAEMYDLRAGGAVAFSDGIRPVQNADILLKALQYVKAIDSLVIQVPEDRGIQPGGMMNEGIISTRMGIPGRASLGEEMMVSKCIDLLRYTESRIHLSGISAARSIELIRQAKKEGLQISCSVTPFHMFFSDKDLTSYDTNLKVDPPLRNANDKAQLIKALEDGTIDCIASHHIPLHSDEKICEFEKAMPGASGLESCFGILNSLIDNADLVIKIMYENPRQLLGLAVPEIKTGAAACLTLFDPHAGYVFEESMIRSASKNNPFIGKTLKGKVFGTYNKDQLTLNH